MIWMAVIGIFGDTGGLSCVQLPSCFDTLDCRIEVMYCFDNDIGMYEGWSYKSRVLEENSVGDVLCLCGTNVNVVAVIVFQGRAKVPAITCMLAPRWAFARLVIKVDTAAEGHQR